MFEKGDVMLQIFLLKRANVDPVLAEVGTDADTLIITNHGMQTGEMILNTSRNSLGNPASRAVTLVDANTLQLNKSIDNQVSGDSLFLFKYVDITNMLKSDTFNLPRTIQKSTCNFSLVIDNPSSIPLEGQQILIKHNNIVIFGGSIYDVRLRLSGIPNDGHKIIASISSNGYNHIPARRSITVDYHIPKTSGQIVTDMVNNYLSSEGITAGTIQAGADWNEYPSDFPDKCISVKQVLDDMASKSGYKWYIDIERRLHFVENDDVIEAPHIITDSGSSGSSGLGIEWGDAIPSTDNVLTSVIYANGKFTILPNSVTLISSSHINHVVSFDGINWDRYPLPGDTATSRENWKKVCYGNGIYVAVSNDASKSRILTSTDGISWNMINVAGSGLYGGVAYGNGKFVIVSTTSSNNKSLVSSDGLNWSVSSTGIDSSWNGVAYGNGKFVAIGDSISGNIRVMISDDGISWDGIETTNEFDLDWDYIAYGNGKFVAVARNGMMISTDGLSWELKELPSSKAYLIKFSDNIFYFCVWDNYNPSENKLYISEDAISWNEYDMPDAFKDVYYGGGKFVLIKDRVIIVAKLIGDTIRFWNVEITQSLEDYRNKQFVKGGWDYYYGDAMVNFMENVDGIVNRQLSEGGSGVYGAIYVDDSEDTNVTEMTAEAGTTSTNVNITAHGLKYGDMVMNLTNRTKAKVSTVIDENNFMIDPGVDLQGPGDIIAVYPDANAICRNNLNKYGLVAPKTITFETTALDFVPGTKLTVNLQVFGMTANEYYLIESVTLRDEDGINLLASVSATQRDETEFNTQQSETWVDTFAKLGGSDSGKQVVEMTTDQADSLAYFTPGKYIDKKDDVLPVLLPDLVDGVSGLGDVIEKVNALIQALTDRQHLSDGTPVTGLKRVDFYKYS